MPEKTQIVFLDSSTVSRNNDVDVTELQSLGELTIHATTNPESVADRIASADIVLTNKVVLDRDRIKSASKLKLVAVTATGTNNIDLAAFKDAGVQVCNVSGYSTASVAQHAIAMLLNLTTNIHRFSAEPQAWCDSPIFTRLDYPVHDVEGRTLGIVGAGNIGGRVGEIALAFGMQVQCLHREGAVAQTKQGWPRVAHKVFFTTSDVVSLHCPLTPDTRHLLNAATFELMKPDAIVINTGRGELIDETALLKALTSGQIGGAGLDVLSQEPPPAEHLLIKNSHPNLLITPHTAWSSFESRRRLMAGVVENVRQFLATGECGNRIC